MPVQLAPRDPIVRLALPPAYALPLLAPAARPLQTVVAPRDPLVRLALPPAHALPLLAPAARALPTVVAPDGMERNQRVSETSLERAEMVQRAKTAPVPQRVQIGPTCGLYALGMVMDAWNERDARNPTALVQSADLDGLGRNYTREPTTSEHMLDVAIAAGFSAVGEMFTARQLAKTASHFGYTASTHEHATLNDLYRVLAAGHPAIVGFDVDYNGNPTDAGGARAHYAVIQGFFDDDGERYLVARHGWGVQTDHVWKAADFDRSWKGLQTTTYYGTPGDGVIPSRPDLSEPSQMHLPDAGEGRAYIQASLGTKIIEVVPHGHRLVGGTRA